MRATDKPAKASGRAGRAGHSREGAAPENPITVYRAWCKRCGICAAFCPKHVLEAGPDGAPEACRPEDCIRCHLCELRCPDFAISVANGKEDA